MFSRVLRRHDAYERRSVNEPNSGCTRGRGTASLAEHHHWGNCFLQQSNSAMYRASTGILVPTLLQSSFLWWRQHHQHHQTNEAAERGFFGIFRLAVLNKCCVAQGKKEQHFRSLHFYDLADCERLTS